MSENRTKKLRIQFEIEKNWTLLDRKKPEYITQWRQFKKLYNRNW